MILSEACIEYSKYSADDYLTNAQKYAHDIIGNLNNGMTAFYCHSANYLEAFLSVYLETNSGSNSVMGILNYCCPAK